MCDVKMAARLSSKYLLESRELVREGFLRVRLTQSQHGIEAVLVAEARYEPGLGREPEL